MVIFSKMQSSSLNKRTCDKPIASGNVIPQIAKKNLFSDKVDPWKCDKTPRHKQRIINAGCNQIGNRIKIPDEFTPEDCEPVTNKNLPELSLFDVLSTLNESSSDKHQKVLKAVDIANSIKEINKEYIPNLMNFPEFTGIVNPKEFTKALEVYENNQSFYKYCWVNGLYSESEIKTFLTTMEHWFICIIEPRPINDVEDWVVRETQKLKSGVSSYSDDNLRSMIGVLPENVKRYIDYLHSQLF